MRSYLKPLKSGFINFATRGHQDSPSNPSQQNSNKNENFSPVCFGNFNSISYCIDFFNFFYYEKLSGKGANRVTSPCPLSINQTGLAWGQTRLELGVRIPVPGLSLTSPVTLDQNPLFPWATCPTSILEGLGQTIANVSPEPTCPNQKTKLHLLLYPLPLLYEVDGEKLLRLSWRSHR